MIEIKIPDYWKPKKIRFNLDTDGDGVIDSKDCKPLDRRYQHISKTMKKRIEKLPIYSSPNSIFVEQRKIWENMKDKIDKENPDVQEEVVSHYYTRDLPHILSKESEGSVAKEMFLSAVSKYPGIVGDIEKAKPRKVIITSKRQPDIFMPRGWVSPQREVFVGPQTPYLSRTQRKKFAKSMYHELKHARQLEKTPFTTLIKQYPTYRDEYVDFGKVAETEEEFDDVIEKYVEVPVEKEAIAYSKEKMKEYHKRIQPYAKARGKERNRILGLE